MSLAAAAGKIGDHFARSLEHAVRSTHPFEHWLIEDALPPATCNALAALPIAPTRTGQTGNAARFFFSAENRARFPVADNVASTFQCRATVREIEELFGIELRGALLRIECGFSLAEADAEPSAGARLFTMRIRLSHGHAGSGTIVIPAARHALKQVPIEGAERSLVVDYVTPAWRARDELSYPERPVG